MQTLVAGLYWVQKGSIGLHQQLISAYPPLHCVQQPLLYCRQLGSIPRAGQIQVPAWKKYPLMQEVHAPVAWSQVPQRTFTIAHPPSFKQQPLRHCVHVFPENWEQQGMEIATATMQLKLERVYPAQQERQLPLVMSLSLHKEFRTVQMPVLEARQYPLAQVMQAVPCTLMQQGSLLRLVDCVEMTQVIPESQQPPQQEAQAFRAGVQVLQFASIFWQAMPGVRQYPLQQEVQIPDWSVLLQLESTLLVELVLTVQLPWATTYPWQQLRQFPLAGSVVLHSGLL